MQSQKLGSLLALLALASLILAACQPARPESANPPTESAAAVTTAVAVTAAPPLEPAQVVTLAAPTTEASAEMQVPEGWQVVKDETQGYALAYPTAWAMNQETRYSRIFSEIQKEPAGMGPPLRLYVSVYPQDYTNADWEVYNFIPSEIIRAFAELPVGDSRAKVPGGPALDYFTYTRLPDQVVAGKTGLVIENAKVWEMPSGTKDRVILIVSGGTTYMLGMYYETPEQLAMFEQVLDSFQFAR